MFRLIYSKYFAPCHICLIYYSYQLGLFSCQNFGLWKSVTDQFVLPKQLNIICALENAE